MMRKREMTIGRVLLVWLAGLVAGVQLALYLFDRYDDGVADARSLWIALAMIAAGVGFVAWTFRRRRG